jgi:hypothetical protein
MRNLMVYEVIVILLLAWIAIADTHIPAGDVFGTWTSAGSPYLIEGEITVPSDSTLNIQPGVDVIFQGHYKFIIHGCLQAIGSESDSILFTAADTSIGWYGLRFIDATELSQLSYCIVQYGRHDEIGGGIYCESSYLMYSIIIDHCLIRYNQASQCGGIGGEDSPAMVPHFTISYSTISDNVATGGCGGIGSDCTDLYYCNILRNSAMGGGGGGICSGGGTLSHCLIKDNSANWGGGVHSFMFGPDLFEYCEFDNNSAISDGGAVRRSTMTYTTFRECVFTNNSATQGGAVILISCAATFEKCTFSSNSANYGSCIVGGGYDPNVIRNTIFANNTGSASLYFSNPTCHQITYCDFYNNQGGNFIGDVPDSLGELMGVNVNGDSCDVFFNIFLNPQFVDPMDGDYHLQSTSPCIDAGDPASPHDPDGTIADMGAFYYPHSGIPENHAQSSLPTSFQLFQNYPNPFNPTTKISFSLPIISKITLSIYDLIGRHITTLIDDQLDAGYHRFTFDASNLSSGIYFYQLQANNFIATKKMVFIK